MKNNRKPIIIKVLMGTLLVLLLSACSVFNTAPAPVREAPTAQPTIALPTSTQEAQPTPLSAPTPTAETPDIAHTENDSIEGVLYEDNFDDPESGWPASVKFDNYFIGYHEPSYYHVEVHSPNDKAVVAVQKKIFTDFTLESKVFTEPNNTAPDGGYRYGLIFRRSGTQYYAFTISPREKTWQLLKSSSSGTQELRSGTHDDIRGLTESDTLRVDVKGTAFSLWINEEPVARASDADYASGEVGFFVETVDIPRVHIHYENLLVREVELPEETMGLLYKDDFTDPKSGWPESIAFDNYFIGYHEPSYFHVEVHAAYDKAVVTAPDQTFSDITMESDVFTEPNNTAAEGTFRYGLIFRRSGNQYYAFAISPRESTWYLLKVAPGVTQELLSGTDASIQGLTASDRLRVDANGSDFYLWINNQLIGQASDSSYTSGEAGFFVETFSTPRLHVHYDTLTVREVDLPQANCTILIKGLNVREGPSMNNDVRTVIRYNEKFEPVARSRDGQWLEVRVESSLQSGWVSYSTDFFACEVAVEDLPIRLP